jgi:hypothetical protein
LRQWVDYHPITTSILWRGGVRAGDAHAGRSNVHMMRFEDLVQDPETTLGPLLKALDIQFDPQMLDVPRQSSSNAANSGGTGLDKSTMGRGLQQLSAAEIWISQRVTGAVAQRHGYLPQNVAPPFALLALTLASWPLKTVAALALNMRRTRSLGTSIRRRLGTGAPLERRGI